MKKLQRDTIGNARLQGIACALGKRADAHMEPDFAQMVLESLGITMKDLQAAGADPYDLKRLNGSEVGQGVGGAHTGRSSSARARRGTRLTRI